MVLKVNGEIVPEDAVEFELGRLIRFYSQHMNAVEMRKQMDLLRQKAKDQAIGAKLLINLAEKMNFVVTDEEVEKSLQNMIQEVGGEKAFREIICKQRVTEPMVRENIRLGRKVDMLIQKVTEGAKEPTQEEIKAHFEAHSDEYKKPERVCAQHILLAADSGSKDDNAVAKSRLLEIKKRIDDGSDFSKEAEAHSGCPSGKKTGGSLGWFSRGMMVPEFDNVVFSMAIGEVSDIIETQFGFHIIKKIDQEDGRPADFDEAHEKVREFLRHSYRGEMLSNYVQDLKDKAVISEE